VNFIGSLGDSRGANGQRLGGNWVFVIEYLMST
jgi:hypothetical protein